MSTCFLYCFGFILLATSSTSIHLQKDDDLPQAREGTVGKINSVRDSDDKPSLSIYYETMCPHCRTFYSTYLTELSSKLGQYIDIVTYPYGKAATTVYYNNTIKITCQHGDDECYGNKLQACALQMPNYIPFNACLMDFNRTKEGSDDAAVDECSSILKIDEAKTKEIKECAKRYGTYLLSSIGQLSRGKFATVPHVEINGRSWNGEYEDIIKDVCAAFKNPPEPCKNA